MQIPKSSLPAVDGAKSSPSATDSDAEIGKYIELVTSICILTLTHIEARLVQILSNVRISPAAANALITAIGLVSAPGGAIIDIADTPSAPAPAPAVASTSTPEASAPAAPTVPVTAESFFQEAPSNAAPGQPSRFVIPRPGSVGPFFVVSRGLSVGVFSGW